ncbi:MAG: hypothetical protein AAFV32_01605 [Myxococcota bacterium]
MLGLFKSNALPDHETIEWLFAVYRWLFENTFAAEAEPNSTPSDSDPDASKSALETGFEQFIRTPIILPTAEHFPNAPDDADEPTLAEHLFACTKLHAGLEDWPCELEHHTNAPRMRDLVGLLPSLESSSMNAAGTFRIDRSRRVVITYAEGSTSDPVAFIATMAHELAHYLMMTIPTPPPGGEDAEEPATDLTAVFMGFGVFTANAAVRFNQFSDGTMIGWSMSRTGYLTEQSIAYALAIFLTLTGTPFSVARSHLDPNPRSYTKAALKDLRKRRQAELDRLREFSPRT